MSSISRCHRKVFTASVSARVFSSTFCWHGISALWPEYDHFLKMDVGVNTVENVFLYVQHIYLFPETMNENVPVLISTCAHPSNKYNKITVLVILNLASDLDICFEAEVLLCRQSARMSNFMLSPFLHWLCNLCFCWLSVAELHYSATSGLANVLHRCKSVWAHTCQCVRVTF